MKRTSCWRELAQSHLIQHKPSAAYAQREEKNLAWPSLTPHTKPERPWRQWINCSPLSLIHRILNRNELQTQKCCSPDYKRPKRGILFNFVQTENKKQTLHFFNYFDFFYFFCALGRPEKETANRLFTRSYGTCGLWHAHRTTSTRDTSVTPVNNTSMKQQATEENFPELPSPPHHTCQENSWWKIPSPHISLRWNHLESGGVVHRVYPGCSLFKPTLLEPPKLASRTI